MPVRIRGALGHSGEAVSPRNARDLLTVFEPASRRSAAWCHGG